MDSAEAIAAPNPVAYAEDTLAVHAVWEDMQALLEEHDGQTCLLMDLDGQLRDVKRALAYRKHVIESEGPGKYQGAKSEAELKRFIKADLDSDEELSNIEVRLDGLYRQRDATELARKHTEFRLTATTARMQELSGLLQFYAVAKAAAIQQVPQVQHVTSPAQEGTTA